MLNMTGASFTIIQNRKGEARKTLSLDKDSKLIKRSAAQIYNGTARRCSVENLAEFQTLLSRAQPDEAFAYGICAQAQNSTGQPVPSIIAVKDSDAVRSGKAIARTREFFEFPSPAIFFLDYDEGKRGHAEVDSILADAWPAWGRTERLWVPSSSSGIYELSTGRELAEGGGWHAYLLVDDGARIPALTEFLYKQLWAKGFGYIAFSAAGSMLERTLIDASVSQPERLDFIAPAKLEGDLERRAPRPVLLPGAPMAMIGKLPLVRGHRKRVEAAKAAAQPESTKRQQGYKAKRVAADAEHGTPPEAAERRWQLAMEDRILEPDFELKLTDGRTVTVQDVLDNPADFDCVRCADPLEPDYRDDERIAIIYPFSARIYSHAHGGITYYLDVLVVERPKDDDVFEA